jgi:arylsulfatase
MSFRTSLSALALVALGAQAQAQQWPDRSTLPIPLAPFEGKVGETYQQSEPDWQEPVAAPEDAPNIIVILLDDVGFGQTSTFGGLIPTPELDALAEEGLKFTRFHTTAICGPSRAALLTGRNHHSSGNGFLMEWATGFPSYSTMLPRETATIGEILKATAIPLGGMAKTTTHPTGRQQLPARLTGGPPAWALTISMVSTRAKRTSFIR